MTHDKYIELRSAIIAGNGVEALELLWAQQKESESKPVSETKCECQAMKALVEAAIPLEVIYGQNQVCEYQELSPVVISAVARAVEFIRKAVKDPCPCEGLRMTIDLLREGWTEDRERLRGELSEARKYALEAMSSLKIISESARELSTILREKWKVPPNIDETTIYCAALLTGFASAWKENPPKNGFVYAVKFEDLGTLEIQIRRIEGKSAAESLIELTAERDQLHAACDLAILDKDEAIEAFRIENLDLRAERDQLRAELDEARASVVRRHSGG